MPRKIKSATVQVVTGIWKGGERLRDPERASRSAKTAPSSPRLTDATPVRQDKSTRVPQLEVARLKKGANIRIDGKLDEAAWSERRPTPGVRQRAHG